MTEAYPSMPPEANLDLLDQGIVWIPSEWRPVVQALLMNIYQYCQQKQISFPEVLEIKRKLGSLVVYLKLEHYSSEHQKAIDDMVEASVQELLTLYPLELYSGWHIRQNAGKKALEEDREKGLSTANLRAYLHCPKHLWLQVNNPELLEEKPTPKKAKTKDLLEGIRACYPDDAMKDYDLVLHAGRTEVILAEPRVVVAGKFRSHGIRVTVDLLIPNEQSWQLTHVVSSLKKVTEETLNELAMQCFVLQNIGFSLSSIEVAQQTRKKDQPCDQQLIRMNLTEEVQALAQEIPDWIVTAKQLLAQETAPNIAISKQCTGCIFQQHCQSQPPHDRAN